MNLHKIIFLTITRFHMNGWNRYVLRLSVRMKIRGKAPFASKKIPSCLLNTGILNRTILQYRQQMVVAAIENP
ncbi:hypothetical protein, partial [Spirochaeta dissipatitropha]